PLASASVSQRFLAGAILLGGVNCLALCRGRPGGHGDRPAHPQYAPESDVCVIARAEVARSFEWLSYVRSKSINDPGFACARFRCARRDLSEDLHKRRPNQRGAFSLSGTAVG